MFSIGLTEAVAALFVEIVEAVGALLAAGAVGQVRHVTLAAARQHALGGDAGADGLVAGQAGQDERQCCHHADDGS